MKAAKNNDYWVRIGKLAVYGGLAILLTSLGVDIANYFVKLNGERDRFNDLNMKIIAKIDSLELDISHLRKFVFTIDDKVWGIQVDIMDKAPKTCRVKVEK